MSARPRGRPRKDAPQPETSPPPGETKIRLGAATIRKLKSYAAYHGRTPGQVVEEALLEGPLFGFSIRGRESPAARAAGPQAPSELKAFAAEDHPAGEGSSPAA